MHKTIKFEKNIFKKASTTYYVSSLFFPKQVKHDVFRLYSFVRMADDYVDATPQDTQGFRVFREEWAQALKHKDTAASSSAYGQNRAINNMRTLVQKYEFDSVWVEAFLDAMQSDINQTPCKTYDETLSYCYGSAEVIGLMMAKIMDLPTHSYDAAQKQGRAMQLINFIRDIAEDNALGRQYLPQDEVERYGLQNLSQKEAHAKPDAFNLFMQFQIERFRAVQAEAEKGYKYLPGRYLVPVKTAAQMYSWTANQIAKNPHVVFEKKVKPSKHRIVATAATNSFSS